jgi:hypothetical protein
MALRPLLAAVQADRSDCDCRVKRSASRAVDLHASAHIVVDEGMLEAEIDGAPKR